MKIEKKKRIELDRWKDQISNVLIGWTTVRFKLLLDRNKVVSR